MGVEIHLGSAVTGVDERGIDTNATDPALRRIEAATKIWAAGVQASPLGRIVAKAAGAEVDHAGRVQVRPDCTLPRHPEVFVVGDLMSLDHLPGLAQVAMQSGRHAAKTISCRLRGDTAERPFHYHDLGTMATISRFQAVASIGRVRAAGFPAWLLWLAVHLFAITGFKNRVAVMSGWTIAFLGRGRPQRATTMQQVFARQALESQAAVIGRPAPSQPLQRTPPANSARA
jgi:NADH dehydrogenase